MNTRMICTMGLSALMLGGSVVGCAADASHVAAISDHRPNASASASAAAKSAARASSALARHDGATAVAFAEPAVAGSPADAGYRMLLARSYLAAGRFASARTAFAETLTLSPDNGRAALDLALTEIAGGDWRAARDTLDAHAATIPVADRGLAIALAGDPQTAVAVLTDAARAPGASVTVRQNLALSLALGGNWAMARAVAAADLSPADVDRRMAEWAAFAKPNAAADQVSALLGVRPVVDPGQPVALALVTPEPPVATAAAEVARPVVAAASAPVPPAPVATVPAQAVPVAAPAVIAAPHEVVQPLPVETIAATPVPARIKPMSVAMAGKPARAVAPASAKGPWFVQLGAFNSVAVAHDKWRAAQRRMPILAAHQAFGMTYAAKGQSFYRLSVGGFARADADTLCHRIRSAGGVCFVRRGSDQLAQWSSKPVELASR